MFYVKKTEEKPKSSHYHFQLAELYDDEADYCHAETEYLKCLEINPKDEDCMVAYGLMLIKQSRLK